MKTVVRILISLFFIVNVAVSPAEIFRGIKPEMTLGEIKVLFPGAGQKNTQHFQWSAACFLSDPPVKPLSLETWGYKGVPFGGARGWGTPGN